LSGTRWIRVTKKSIAERSYSIDDLVEGSDYEFRVVAENAAGVGQPSETTGKFVAKNPFDVPGRPDAPEVTDLKADSATISYRPPASDGGSPITGYIIEVKAKLDSKWKVAGKDVKETEYVVDGLKEGTDYEFRVTAENKAGQGQPSPPSKPAKYGNVTTLSE
jgi:titin